MNKLKKYFYFLLVLCWAQMANAYILNQTKSGTPVHWPSASTTVDIYVNSQNTQGLNEATIQSIAATSLTQWNGKAQVSIRKNTTTNKGQADLNEFYFSTDPNVFNGSGVVGITQVSFKESTGEIIEADILVNDNFPFSLTTTDQAYLGNVVTHEAGHFLGLGHGQVVGSTMFYALSKGQSEIDYDDEAGLYAIYPSGSNSLGSLTGTVIGGKNLIPVFGAQVQAISVKTGKVMGAGISESNGQFKIAGLPLSDQYILYTSPIKKIGLPTNYANVRSDFCEGGKSYRGSFFQSCGSSAEGFPLAINLNSSQQDVGKVTIRCGLDSPPEYLQTKSTSPAQFDVNSYSNSGLGGTFTGFFSQAEISSGVAHDYFRLNFSSISNWDSISTSPSLYLHLKIVNQSFFSPFKANISVTRSGVTTAVTPKYSEAADGWLNIDTNVYLPINRVTSSDNDFEITINPEDMKSSFPTGIPGSRSDYFPSYDDFVDSLYFYIAIADIVKSNGDGTYTQVSARSDVLSDNASCPDAVNTYALSSYTTNGTSSSSDRKKGAGCGTVDMDNDTRGGPGGFMIGLFVSFIFSYALTRYSKMA